MRRILSLGIAVCLAITMLAGCQRSKAVHAGNDKLPAVPDDQDIKGELISMDIGSKTLIMRVENGMEQTVKWNNDTEVYGVPLLTKPGTPNKVRTAGEFKVLASAPGSEMVIRWVDDNGEKIATVIDVKDMAEIRKSRKHR